MTESQLTRRIICAIRRQYPLAWLYKTADKFTWGIPDILMLNRRRFYALEIKLSGKKPTPIQVYTIKEINQAGGFACVVTSIDEALYAIKKGGD